MRLRPSLVVLSALVVSLAACIGDDSGSSGSGATDTGSADAAGDTSGDTVDATSDGGAPDTGTDAGADGMTADTATADAGELEGPGPPTPCEQVGGTETSCLGASECESDDGTLCACAGVCTGMPMDPPPTIWMCVAPNPDGCPETPPAQATACDAPVWCRYNAFSTCGGMTARCLDGEWSIQIDPAPP